MKKNILVVISILLLTPAFGQKAKLIKAEKAYNNYNYINTTKILLSVAEKGYKSTDVFKKLGDSYYYTNQMEDAVKWYGKLMNMASEEGLDNLDPEYYFRYGQALKSIERYTDSDIWMTKFSEKKTQDLRAQAFLNDVDYLSEINSNDNSNITLFNLNINSEYSDFGSVLYGDQLVFTSSRGGGRDYKWNDQPYLDLYIASKETDSTYGEVKSFGDEINTKYHESSVAFLGDSVLYFTRNNYYKGKFKQDSDNTNRLHLFKSTKENDSWTNIEFLDLNKKSYSISHPTINSKGDKMYFASDMPGSIGLSDLYVVSILEDGSLGEPENLGVNINTQGQETFPFINKAGDLFFSSNSYPGLGGLDVYVIRDFEIQYESSKTYVLENLGLVINSPQDDFAYYEEDGGIKGFVSSNRENGKGDDDIYSFQIAPCQQIVSGVVKDKVSLEVIPMAIVTLFDENGNKLTQQTANEEGFFSFSIDCEKEYLLRGAKEGYIPNEKRLVTPSKKQKLEVELLLEKEEQPVNIGDDLAKILDIPMIYFDFDKSNIRPDAEVELQKIVEAMKMYPRLKLDIRSHTDSRANDAYNMTLSNRRAKSTMEYLIKEGIAKSRLTAQGYGETQLVNRCSNGVQCSKEEHQANRRSEFIIIK